MGTIERLTVVAPLEPLREGQQFETYPAHFTVYGPFDLDTDNWPYFAADMEDLMDSTSAPLITGGNEVLFGPNENLPARRLDRLTPTFNRLIGFDIHAGVYRSAHELGTNLDDTYYGLDWHPHVSGTYLAEDESKQITSLAVVKKLEQRSKIVKAVFEWSNRV